MATNDLMLSPEAMESRRADVLMKLREAREEFRALEEKILLGQPVDESRHADLKSEIERLAREHSELGALISGDPVDLGSKNPLLEIVDRLVDYKMYIFWGLAVAAVVFLMIHLSNAPQVTEKERAAVRESLGAAAADRMRMQALENQDRAMRNMRDEARREGMPVKGIGGR